MMENALDIAERTFQNRLSPYFLYNTINTIYDISLVENESVPSLLLELSDLMRYALYDAKKPLVPLFTEVEYLYQYLDFEEIRLGDMLDLSTSFENLTDSHVQIAPLLLIALTEQAFEQAISSGRQKISVDLSLRVRENSLLFTIKASANTLMALRKTRLEVYKDQYELDTRYRNETYQVQLRLKMDQPESCPQ